MTFGTLPQTGVLLWASDEDEEDCAGNRDVVHACPAPEPQAAAYQHPRRPSFTHGHGQRRPLLFALLWFAFWKTKARYDPGKLVGLFVLGYGIARFTVEFFREPDSQLRAFAEHTGLHMGQWLCVPMLLFGAWLMARARGPGGPGAPA